MLIADGWFPAANRREKHCSRRAKRREVIEFGEIAALLAEKNAGMSLISLLTIISYYRP
jgi:hypothetical protein